MSIPLVTYKSRLLTRMPSDVFELFFFFLPVKLALQRLVLPLAMPHSLGRAFLSRPRVSCYMRLSGAHLDDLGTCPTFML
ncbi:hypothetical protein BDR05DRAFT_445256 [Suillus weaverae]|nr:hypothetical protein BDR05DRAFT_445256 [Suillus weaverae]